MGAGQSKSGAGNCIYRKGDYIILTVGHEYIVVNREKVFKDGHTHIKSFKTAEMILNMALHKRVPSHLSSYLLTSLKRISNDEDYVDEIESLIDVKVSKKKGGRGYYNAPCCR